MNSLAALKMTSVTFFSIKQHIHFNLNANYRGIIEQRRLRRVSACVHKRSPDPSLIAHIKYECRSRLRTECRPLAQPDTSTLAFNP